MTPVPPEAEHEASEVEALRRAVTQQFDQYVKLNKKIPPEILTSIAGIDDAGRLADTIAAHLPLKLENKQSVLDLVDVDKRAREAARAARARGRHPAGREAHPRPRQAPDGEEPARVLPERAGQGDPEGARRRRRRRRHGGAREEDHRRQDAEGGAKKADAEFKKLKLMSPMSAEATVVRNYIDTLVNLPWAKKTKIKHDLALRRAGAQRRPLRPRQGQGPHPRIPRGAAARRQGQGADPVPGRALRASARPRSARASPRATGRKFVRMALGGVRDEAEIRGHRRTYIGSMPGKVLQSLTKIGTRNPLFLLDEIDKLGMDFRGDPSSALLEVLDPEQNHTFSDHYVEVDFDLSDTMFIATSNSMNIPPALLDRMEVIRLSGYTEDEKVNIALRYLLPKQQKNNGVEGRGDGSHRVGGARHRPLLHARGGRALARARDRQDLPQGRQGDPAQAGQRQGRRHRGQPQRLPGRAQVRLRPGREGEPGRPGGRPGVDRGRRRPADDRGGGDARQGQHHPHRLSSAT